MAQEPWLVEELRMGRVARRALVRGMHRPVLVLAVALAITGVFIAGRVRRPPSYEATLYFRLAEGDLSDPSNAPRPLSSIREYIANVALSRDRVEQLMKKHGVSRAFLSLNRVAAIDGFRENIQIDVSRNYFIYGRQAGEPRSAQVTISLSGSDPERTRVMLHEIGDTVLEVQAAQRSGHLARARQLIEVELSVARAREEELQKQLDALGLEVARADARDAVGLRAEIAAQQAEAQGAIAQVTMLERRASEVAFTTAAEEQSLLLSFDLFDESLVTSAPRLTGPEIARLAALVFAVMLLLTVGVVGAFDDRVYASGDLSARGLPIFGALPRFPGDDVGSYRERVRTGRV